jgi:hypothetical protein
MRDQVNALSNTPLALAAAQKQNEKKVMRGSIRKRGQTLGKSRLNLSASTANAVNVCHCKGTYKDAQKELTRLLSSADDGTLPDPTRMTVGDYLRAYLDNALSLSPKTLERYRELADPQVIPHLGDVKLQKLRPETIGHGTLRFWRRGSRLGL